MLAWSRDWPHGITHDHVTDNVVYRHNFNLETIRGAVNIRTPTFRLYENLWRSPIGQSLECAITGYKYPVHSHFSELLSTVNWPISSRRNSPPLSSHHKSRAQSLLRKYSKAISELVLAKFPHHLGENIQRLLRLQNFLGRKSSTPRKYSKPFSPQNCLSRKSSISWNYSKTFPPSSSIPAATINHPATSSSNHQSSS